MAEDNLSGSPEPVATTPPTQESLVEDISNLLEPPETDQPEEHAKERRHSGAVGAEDAVDLARYHADRDVVDRS